jgi:hypothetical protein
LRFLWQSSIVYTKKLSACHVLRLLHWPIVGLIYIGGREILFVLAESENQAWAFSIDPRLLVVLRELHHGGMADCTWRGHPWKGHLLLLVFKL